MVISTINQTVSHSVTPFGSFSGSSRTAVTSVLSNNKPSNEQASVSKTPKLSINNIVNGQSALKSTKKTIKSPQPDASNQFRPSFAILGTPEFDHASKSSLQKPSSELRGGGVGTATPFARRLPCTFQPEEPLPPIFSIFD